MVILQGPGAAFATIVCIYSNLSCGIVSDRRGQEVQR